MAENSFRFMQMRSKDTDCPGEILGGYAPESQNGNQRVSPTFGVILDENDQLCLGGMGGA